ncbi:MAG TPA: GNAT family N-acetyltransferase [Candidatus Eisenbacteria bacterium]|nr:GNAT family N-acetyltransferase [Candidatus Eisenbacteria bacterium]
MTVSISRPQKQEEKVLQQFFETVITHTFKLYGYYENYKEDIAREVKRQMTALQQDFTTNGTNTHFLIARDDNTIVGTIAYGPVNDDIKQYYKKVVPHIPEVKSLYILPEYQGQGIGTQLFNEIRKIMQENGIKEFYLDSGYPKAQEFWKHKLGDPVHIVHDRWDAGNDYMIWYQRLK